MPPPRPPVARPPPRPPTEFDALDIDSLTKLLQGLTEDTTKVAAQRAEAQKDRDAVERFYEISKRELREVELASVAKEREMELMAENHRSEEKVYQQKVKHLEYEHAHAMRKLGADEGVMLRAEGDDHGMREASLRAEKASLRSRLREMEESHAEAVRQMKALQEKNSVKLRQEFQLNLEQLRAKYDTRLQVLVDDLKLRHSVEVHEVEERKNLHINQLMRAHDEAFTEMKRYYNDITRANLQLITQLRAQIAEANEKVAANQKLMREISDQNEKLKEPLEAATKDLATLQDELKDAEKDRQSLKYAKARLASLRGQITSLERSHLVLEKEYASAERERDELYAKFATMVQAARVHSEAKNEALEKRLADAEFEFISRKAQVQEVLVAAKLDPAVMSVINAKLDSVLETRNAMIKELQQSVAMLAKAHNDAARVYDARMRALGVPAAEVVPEMFVTATGVGPAGLVAKPAIT